MSNVHLLVLIHGMWGSPQHLSELNRMITEVHSEPSQDGAQLVVLLAKTNTEDSTYDGIDWGGERVAQEVQDEVSKLEEEGKRVTRMSVTGYSLGGLVARYVIGILHQKQFFNAVTPVNFNTIATPHIGLPRYDTVISSLLTSLGQKLLSRTGEQFYCSDKWSPKGRPLLEVMADPDRVFFQALALFQNRRIYANAVNDVTVPYVTSAIETYDIFADASTKGLDVEIEPEYGLLIKSFSQPSQPPPPKPKPRPFTRKWLRQLKPKRPMLPPALQGFKFPYNVILYISLPLLLPVAMSLVLIRLSLASRSSRARIKLLETDASSKDSLLHTLATLEKQVEDAVADMMDDPGEASKDVDERTKQQPVLSLVQKRIAKNLNTLNIEKKLAYIEHVRNSHATIVCRDVKRFPLHRKGEGIVRHWADSFVL